ncbi:MAG: type II toxin-antitoxin system VapC family toxin [Brachymonas sp.]|nr:type II toxin-antitoxin system VapC family toxin [Brachymonas sp.]
MIHLLDTNTFTAIVKGHPKALAAFAKLDIKNIKLSAIHLGEIEYGLTLNPVGSLKLARIKALLQDIEVLALDTPSALIYGQIRTDLQKRGEPIGANDFWIAAHALSLGATLVTNNVREFKRVKGLKVENWLI